MIVAALVILAFMVLIFYGICKIAASELEENEAADRGDSLKG